MRRKNTSEVEQKKEQAGVQLKNFNCMPFFSLNYVAFLLSGSLFPRNLKFYIFGGR